MFRIFANGYEKRNSSTEKFFNKGENVLKKILSMLLALMMIMGSLNITTLDAAVVPAVGNEYLQENLKKFPDMFDYEKNQTKVAFSNDNDKVINEVVWIEVPCDVDDDGQRDLIRAEFRRPIETSRGLKTPVIAMATPYVNTYDSLGRLTGGNVDTDNDAGIDNPDTTNVKFSDIEYKGPTYKDLLEEGNGHMSSDLSKYGIPAPRVPESTQEGGTSVESVSVSSLGYTYIPLGYTSARLTIIGSNYGEGFLTYGDYAENLCVSSFVDWLNGRCNAYTNPTDKILVETPAWATGDVFMTGTSYEGTLPFAGLITGVEGLRSIMPIAPVTSSYEYYRANGGVYAPGGWQGEDVTMIIPYCFGRGFWGSDDAPLSPVYNTYQPTKDHLNLWSKYWDYLYECYVNEDRITGDYNTWWDARNQAAFGLEDVRDDVGIIMQHGFNDDNVKFKQTALIYEMAKIKGITAKAIFHQGMHTSVTNHAGLDLNPQLHKWIDHYLYGVENGMPNDMPDVRVQSNVDISWKEYSTWPMGENQKLYLKGDNRAGTMSLTPQLNKTALQFKDKFTLELNRGETKNATIPPWVEGWAENQPKFAGRVNTMSSSEFYRWRNYILGGTNSTAAWTTPWTAPASGVTYDLTKALDDRLLYVFDVEEDMTISGTINMTAKIAADKKVGYISAMLVDIGSAKRYGSRTVADGSVVLPNGANQRLSSWLINGSETPAKIISRGSVDVQNPNYDGTIWSDNAETKWMAPYTYQTTSIEPGKFYPYTWEMDVMEYTIPAGHKLALILYGTDPEYTPRPFNPTEFTVEIGSETYLSLPVIGPIKETKPSVTSITADPDNFGPEGGVSTIILTGTNLETGIKVTTEAGIKVMAFDGETETDVTGITKGGNTRQTAELTFPNNMSSADKTYTVKYSLDGGNTWEGALSVTVSSFEKHEPSIASITANPDSFGSGGGVSIITIMGTNLNADINVTSKTGIKVTTEAGIKVMAFHGETETDITGITKGSNTRQTAELTFPNNTSSADKTYTVKYSLDGGNTWEGALSVTVSAYRRSSSSKSRKAGDNAVISTTKIDFNKDGKDISINLTFNGKTLQSLKNGNATLKEGVDYSVKGNTVTIFDSYLSAMPAGTQTITFVMSSGANPQLSIIIKGTNYTVMQPTRIAGTQVNAVKTNNPLLLEGDEKVFPAINIDNYNWLKLRDIAMILGGTSKQFSLSYDSETKVIDINLGGSYIPLGDELKDILTEPITAIASTNQIRINGQTINIASYNVGGYNYLRLRDIAILLGFNVKFDNATRIIDLKLSESYAE